MDEARLAEIEAYAKVIRHDNGACWLGDMVPDLIAEVRRLKTLNDQLDQFFLANTQDRLNLAAEIQRLKKAVDGAYSDGESNGHADITGIIGDPMAGDDATAEEILNEIKDYLGWED